MSELATVTQQLANVRAAIEAIETGAQDYMIAGRRVVRANLSDLYKREEALLSRKARLERGGIKVRKAFTS